MSPTHTTPQGDARAVAPPSDTGRRMTGAGVFGGLSLVGLVVVVLAAIPFLALAGLVQARWAPLQNLDDAIADGLNQALATSAVAVRVLEIVTELGGGASASYVLVIAVVWLLVRRQRRVAAYLAVTGLGLAVLVPVSKALVGRARPDVATPLVELPTNPSFPSGHAMTAIVTWGAIALVALPVVTASRRRLVVAAAGGLVLLTGFTRLALGVHFLSDVLAGWALGAAWLAVSTMAFRGWLADRHLPHVQAGLGQEPVHALHLRTTAEPALPDGWRTAGRVAVLGVGVAAVVTALGLLVTGWLAGTRVGDLDVAAVATLADLRQPAVTSLVEAVGRAAGLWGVVTASLAIALLSVAHRGSLRPAAFILLAVVGEVALYGAATSLVGRARPDVRDLTSGLPTDAAFPSGHVAAATVVYGGLVTILFTYGRGWWRWAALAAVAVLVATIMVGRVYVAAHHPSDTVGGLVLGVLWLWCLHRAVLAPGLDRTAAWRWDTGRVRP